MEAGETVQATLVHGLTIHKTDLVLGSGGVAMWDFPAGTLTQAGDSQLIVQAGTAEARHTLTVLPDDTAALSAFTTSNSLRAYGDDSTTLLTLVSDSYGNPVDDAALTIRRTSPSGETQIGFARSTHGLASQTIRSIGIPGILRMQVGQGSDLITPLTIVQLAGRPDTIRLRLSADCLLSDGLDNITLTATVADREGFPVTDGQVVLFRWANGGATGITVDGTASVSIPAPQIAGMYDYSAHSGNLSATQSLTVADIAEDPCHD